MALHFGSRASPDQSGIPLKVVGQLRKTQLITTFGSGSIVDMPGYSVMMAGINYWEQKSPLLHEPNLERMLHVSGFREPRVTDSNSDIPTQDVPAFRFPYMHFCPECGRLAPFKKFGDEENRKCSNEHPAKGIVPSRFIVACINGHMEDFPYHWWVHRGSECPESALEIHFTSESGGLESIVIRCTVCGQERSMEGCMAQDALRGYHCKGRRPWFGKRKQYNDPTSCKAPMRTLQRGAANVYFSVTASALTIPPWSSRIQQELAVRWDGEYGIQAFLSKEPSESEQRMYFSGMFSSLLSSGAFQVDDVIQEARHRLNASSGIEFNKQMLLEDEYRVFLKGDYSDPEDLQFRASRTEVPALLNGYVEDVILVKRLREVLALRGFRRITPDAPDSTDSKFQGWHISGDCIPLSNTPLNWLPAIELLGEGIFIRLNEKSLSRWEARMEKYYQPMQERLRQSNIGCENFSARYVLLHTLSHLLIRQLSLECGYSGASIKERIYSTWPRSSEVMAGILLYTSSSDSDGSLGGLVRQGHPNEFEKIFRNMLQDAFWCSSDPICIQSKAQGYDSLNFAACHACTLLPETSCEMRNCLLDRASISGTLEDRDKGFLGQLLT